MSGFTFFLLLLLFFFLEPQAGFRIAFNMFDADGNAMVDKREFMVVCFPFDLYLFN